MLSQTVKSPRIDPKGLHYYGDGTGRDGYVLRFNGGLFSQNMIGKLKPRPQNSYESFHNTLNKLRKQNPTGRGVPVQHYQSDGSGRDLYISINDGGRTLNYDFQKKSDNIFSSQLRSYQKIPSQNDQTLRLLGPYGYRSPKQIQNNRIKYAQQTQASFRLSQNKKLREPPQLDFTPSTTQRKFKIKKISSMASLNSLNNQTADDGNLSQNTKNRTVQSTQQSPTIDKDSDRRIKNQSGYNLDYKTYNKSQYQSPRKQLYQLKQQQQSVYSERMNTINPQSLQDDQEQYPQQHYQSQQDPKHFKTQY